MSQAKSEEISTAKFETRPLRIAVLLNEASGAFSNNVSHDRIVAAFAPYGIVPRLKIVSGADLPAQAQDELNEAHSGRLDALVIGGGDGSVAAAARLLADSDIPLGILPLGTFNHFARDLGIPGQIEQAAAVIAARHVSTVDVGEVNGEIFINNSSIGIYPYLVLSRERLREQYGMRKWTAMALAAWRTLRHFPLRRLHIRAGDLAAPYRSPCLFIGNNEYSLTGRIAGQRERLDAGELWVYVAKRQSRFALIWLACRSLAGLMEQSRDLRVVTTTEAEITSRTSRLLVALDGEVTMMRPPLLYRARPQALRVFAPEPVNRADL